MDPDEAIASAATARALHHHHNSQLTHNILFSGFELSCCAVRRHPFQTR